MKRLAFAAVVVAVVGLVYESVMGALDADEDDDNVAATIRQLGQTGPGWHR